LIRGERIGYITEALNRFGEIRKVELRDSRLDEELAM